MLNKVFIFLSILLLCCSCSRNLNSNTSSDISGTWYQVEINLFNDTSSHMYAPVKWTFDKGRCRINISDSKEYEFSTEDNKLSFSPVKGAIYEEWDQKIFFNNEFDLIINDTSMIWEKEGVHKIVFDKNL